jgi:hypothetical protein
MDHDDHPKTSVQISASRAPQDECTDLCFSSTPRRDIHIHVYLATTPRRVYTSVRLEPQDEHMSAWVHM